MITKRIFNPLPKIMGSGNVTKHIFVGLSNPWARRELWGGSGSLTERCLFILPTGRPLWPGGPDVSQCARGLVFSIKAQHGRRKRTDPRIFLLTRIPVQFQQFWSRYVELWHYLRNAGQEERETCHFSEGCVQYTLTGRPCVFSYCYLL